LTSGVGLGLGRFVPHTTAQTLAHEFRVLGLAKAGNGLLEQLTNSVLPEKPEEKK